MTETEPTPADAPMSARLFTPVAWLERPLQTTEAWVGAFFTSLISLGLGIPLVLGAITGPFTGEIDLMWALLFLPLAVLWLAFDAPHLFRTWSCIRRGRRPLAPAAAECQPVYNWVLRPLSSIWFSGHFLLAVWLAHFTIELGLRNSQDPTMEMIFNIVMATAYTFASNGFLVAAVKAFTGSDRWVRRTWNWRVVIDVALVVAAQGFFHAT
jgi:hypothetical protein